MDQAKLFRLAVEVDILSNVSEENSEENIYRRLQSGFGDFKIVIANWENF